MQFNNTIEVFNKIANKVASEKCNCGIKSVEYSVTEKQFEWLAKTYINEAHGWDTRYGVTVTDEKGNKYSFAYSTKRHNVPHYIPNRSQYGATYTITKHSKI